MSLGCKTKITPTKRREGLKIAEKLALFGINHPEEQRMLKKPNYQTFPKQDASTSNSFSSEGLPQSTASRPDRVLTSATTRKMLP